VQQRPQYNTLTLVASLVILTLLACEVFSIQLPLSAPSPGSTIPPWPIATSPLPATAALPTPTLAVQLTQPALPTLASSPTPPLIGIGKPLYFVSPDGDDANPGDQLHPWRTIQKAADTLVAGEMVLIQEGIYNERLRPRNSGTSEAWIVFAGFPREEVILDGDGLNMGENWGGVIDLSGRSYIRVTGLRVQNSDSNGILADGASHIDIEKNYVYNTVSSGIGIWNSQAVRVESNEVVLANNDGEQENITIAGTHGFNVRFNHVHDGGPGTNGGEGIDAKDGSSDGNIYGNHVHHLKRLGIYVDAWDKHTYNIEVFQNVVHDIEASGIVLASEMGGLLENVRLYNNLVYNNQTVGIEIATNGPAHRQPVQKVQIVNNTVYGNGWQEWGGGILVDNKAAKAILIRNNIASQNLSFQVAIERGAPGQVTSDHNLIDGYRNYDGELLGDQDLQGDPLFIDPVNGDFQLQASSPAIDAASPDQAPPDDMKDRPRPQDGNGDGVAGWDIGAYEVVASSSAGCIALAKRPYLE
jgi:hypothetical protein